MPQEVDIGIPITHNQLRVRSSCIGNENGTECTGCFKGNFAEPFITHFNKTLSSDILAEVVARQSSKAELDRGLATIFFSVVA